MSSGAGTRVHRKVRPRAWLAAAATGVRRRRGVSGFVAGTAVGAVLTVLLATVLPNLTDPDDRLEPGELVILSGTDDGLGGQRQKLIEQWNAIGDGRPEAKIIPVAGGANAARSAMVSDAQHGTQGADIYNLDVTMMAEFVEFDYLRPLADTEVDLGGFLDNPLRTCWRDGKLWALPFNTDAALLYYRKDLLHTTTEPSGEGSLPTSWPGINNLVEDIFAGRRAAAAATAPSRSLLLAGYAGQFADYEGLSVNAFEAIWAAGGEVVDDDGRVAIDTPEAREGVNRLVRGLSAGNPQVILSESVNFKEGDTTQAFRDGRVAFMRNWPVAYRSLAGEQNAALLDWVGVTRVPHRSVLGGQNLAISARSDQPRAAQELIEFLTSPRSQQILFERGGFVATQKVIYYDEKIRDDYPYVQTLLEAIEQAAARPDTPYYELFSRVFRQGIRHAFANGGRLPDRFSDNLADALRGIER